MALPFSREQFLGVFEAYNSAIWPAQIALLIAAVAVLVLVWRGGRASARAALAVLAGLWLWMGVAYHWVFFAPINPAAWVFGAAFVGQAGLLVLAAARPVSADTPSPAWSRGLGFALIAYALVVYPTLGQLSDHAYPRSPTFGLPCPTTIFTLGALLVAPGRARPWLAIVPALWAAVGSSAPFAFGIWEDLGLLVAAVVSTVGLLVRVRIARLHAHPLVADPA